MAGLDDLNTDATNVTATLGTAVLAMKNLQDQAGKVSLDGLMSSANKSIDSLFKLQDNIIKTSRGLGQSAAQAKLMETEIGKAAINAVEMGGNLEDVVKNFEQINSTLGRTTYLSSSVLTNIEAIQKFGVADTTIQSFAKFFDKVGGGMDASIQQQIELVNTAKDYGLNVGQFLGSVAGKLDIVNKYGFPKGVSDLASMVAKSQVLGDSLSVAQNFADQIMDSPEKAFEYAAQLQTLGGSFSQLGDGAQLLYMAQNDLKGLNDQLINATRGIATFNQETGQFEISANERLRLRGLKNLGIDADKVEETALKLAKQEQIIGKLNLNPNIAGMSDEEKETLANYAQLQKGGVVTIKGQEIGGLDSESIKNIMVGLQGKGSQLSSESDKNVQMIQSNMSAQEASTVQTNLFNNAIALSVLKIGDFSKTLDTVTAAQTQVISSIRAATVGGETADKLIKSFEDNIKNTSLLITKALDTFTSAKIESKQPPSPLTVTGAAKIEVDVKGLDLKFADAIKPAIVDAVLEEMKKKGYSK
jgi:hypothetical protein